MRLILAGLFVFAGILLAIGLLSGVMHHASSVLIGLRLGVLFIALIIIALVMFNAPGERIRDFKSEEEQIKELEEKGLLVSTDFYSVRAFESVLYLNGQYLYDYELTEDEEHNQPRTFPCTHFTIWRHRDEGYVVDILCRGKLLELENLEPDWDKVPEDGDVITNVSFEELKRRIG